jgi:ribosome-binding protein aMBF1 (putative translation factor)
MNRDPDDVERFAFGLAVEHARKEIGMGTTELSRLAGVTPGAVRAWKDRGCQPNAETRRKVVEVLGIDEEDLAEARMEVLLRWENL